MITEFMSGGSVYDFIRKEKFGTPQLFQMLNGIAKGVAHLHKSNVIFILFWPNQIIINFNKKKKLFIYWNLFF